MVYNNNNNNVVLQNSQHTAAALYMPVARLALTIKYLVARNSWRSGSTFVFGFREVSSSFLTALVLLSTIM